MHSIVHIVSNAPPLFGGAARQAIHLSSLLSKEGVDNKVLSHDDIEVQPDVSEITHICGAGIASLVVVYRYIMSADPRVIMIHGGVKRLILFALFLPRRIRIIFKITTELEINRINKSLVARFIINLRGVFVANITNIQCEIKNQWFISNIPREIDTVGSSAAVDHCNREPTFIVIGAICARKRTAEIITQFIHAKRLQRLGSASRLHIYGPYQNTFAEYDNSYVNSIFDTIKGLDDIRLEGNVDFTAVGFPDNSVLVHSAESEGCPNSVLEFLYLEKPVIVSSNLQRNFPEGLQSFINFVHPGNLFIEMIVPAEGAKKTLDDLKRYYIDKIKCVVYSLQ